MTSPARRYQTYLTNDDLTTDKPYKPLLSNKKRTNGRNNLGKVTVRHRGGGHKRHYRIIDFKRDKFGVPGKVATIEYDPNRSARIALINYADGEKRYIIAPAGLQVGQTIVSGPESDILTGNALPIKNIPLGTQIHNIELKPGKGGQMARSAGSFAQLVAKEGDTAQLGCLRARFASYRSTAWPRSGRWATPRARTFHSGRQGARAGWASA